MFGLLVLLTLTPQQYSNKPEIKASSQVIGDQIFFQYGFKDLKGEYQEWSWQDDYSKLKNLSEQFGINVKDPSKPTYKEGDLEAGLFAKHPIAGAIPDYGRLVSLYQGTVREIYRNWKRTVNEQNLSRRESVELLLRFLQDYPYGIPPKMIDRKFIGGLLVPPLSLETGWADCDSKSLLMASILSFDSYFNDKMAMILVPGHALLGIEMVPSPYDETYKYQNRNFVVAEPTGLSRTPFGKKNSPYTRLIAIIPLEGTASPASENVPTQNGLNPLTQEDCPDEGLLVEYDSDIDKGKIQLCMIKVGEDFIKHGPLLKYDASGSPRTRENYNRGTKL